MAIEDWFLTAQERGNPFTRLDHRHGGRAWTSGNAVRAVIHGAEYFARLIEVVGGLREGDLLLFTDWRGDDDERLTASGPTISELLCGAARRGVIVKGLFWRSHLDALHYSEGTNRRFANDLRRAGGEAVLDQRVPPMGCHHQKLVVARHVERPEEDVAFVGGIDLCHTRRDDARHLGDPQTVDMGAVWGRRPAWHDLMIEVRGPAVGDVEANFRERWDDPTPPAIDLINRLDALVHRDDEHPRPLPPQLPDPPEAGRHHVQVLRTFPPKVPRFPFAPRGERSIARAYAKAAPRAESLVYLEDQYVWNPQVLACFARALAAHPRLRMIIVLSTHTTADTRIADASAMGARNDALAELRRAGGDRVAVYGIENELGTPVYVHSKVCIVDDVWMTIGSDNVNLRSWTYDSELTCAVLDEEADGRAPLSVRADGDPARSLPRAVRLALAREHLGREDGAGGRSGNGERGNGDRGIGTSDGDAPAPGDADLLDPIGLFEAFRASAAALDAWHAGGERGPRPAGRLRRYVPTPVPRAERPIGALVYHLADDPDGRPPRLRGTDRF